MNQLRQDLVVPFADEERRDRRRFGRGGRFDKRDERRSPSPPRDPEPRKKRKSAWDIAPSALELTTLNLIPQPATTGISSTMNPHLSRQARRLYVGNLPSGVSDMELADFFNTALATAGVVKPNTNAVIAVQMNREKAFAFLEFSQAEDATASMAFDGIMLHGHALKVRRPRDYKGPSEDKEPEKESAQMQMLLPNIVSTNVAEGPNKIFVGGLPAYLNEEQVKDLLIVFGPLKSFNLVKDQQTGNSKGFAFFEYLNPDITEQACMQLNGMKIGDKTILVQRAIVGAKQLANGEGSNDVIINPTALNFLNLNMPIAAAAAILAINTTEPGTPTKILQLMNVASMDELAEDKNFDEICDDILTESKKFGSVVSMFVPRPPREIVDTGEFTKLSTPMWGVGRAFVEYRFPEEAKKAQVAYAGRKYNGRMLISGFFSEVRYATKNFIRDDDEERAVAEKYKPKESDQDQTVTTESGMDHVD